ncbi:MAG: alpha-L-fucosidase, partial [Bacteroidales bacterium]|nr:alpha-L-fucosidase [Bacteroidales bacterium]
GEGHEDGDYWVPAEVDVSIRPGWFYHPEEDSLVRSPENLMELYYSSVGRNSNLLLNIPPDKRGLLHEKDVESLMAFREIREKEFENELARGRPARASSVRGRDFQAGNVTDGNADTYWTVKDGQTAGDITIDLGQETEVNRILIQEYIRLGQRVMEFKAEALADGEWILLTEGTTIGYKVIKKFPTVRTSQIRVTINKSKACPLISNIELYRAAF